LFYKLTFPFTVVTEAIHYYMLKELNNVENTQYLASEGKNWWKVLGGRTEISTNNSSKTRIRNPIFDVLAIKI